MQNNGGWLDLQGCTGITSLPDGLTVGGWLDLQGCTGITSLPDGLTVGGSLDLQGCTGITSLPDGLTVGRSLNLRDCTGITSLPDGLTVGGWLNLRGCTGITSLPDGLTVGDWLDLEGCTGLAIIDNCGEYNRSIYAWNHKEKGNVVSLGCFTGNIQECADAINQKYRGQNAIDYIAKVNQAFADLEERQREKAISQ